MGTDALNFDYPNEPIGGGNPYYRCASCKLSDPQINGRIEGHLEWCEWRKKVQPFGDMRYAKRYK